MLSVQEIRDVEACARAAENPRAAAIDALRAVQRRRRWISDAAVREIAGLLGMTADELDDVATFYNLIFRRPVGRHVILFCDSVSCWVMGSDHLRAKVEGALGVSFGGTSQDDRFTLLPICCLGACDRAPVMMIDEDLYADLSPEKVEHALSAYP